MLHTPEKIVSSSPLAGGKPPERCLPLAREIDEKVMNLHLPALGAALNVPAQNKQFLNV